MRTQNVETHKLLYDEETSMCWIQAKNLYQGEQKVEGGGGEAAQGACSAILVPSPSSLKWEMFTVYLRYVHQVREPW